MNKPLIAFLFFPLFAYADYQCDNITTSNQVYLCSKQSLEKSDAALNKTYKDLLSQVVKDYQSDEKLKNEYTNKIKLSQRAWVDFRDKNCQVFSFQIEENTEAYEATTNMCKDKMTQERTRDLLSIMKQ